MTVLSSDACHVHTQWGPVIHTIFNNIKFVYGYSYFQSILYNNLYHMYISRFYRLSLVWLVICCATAFLNPDYLWDILHNKQVMAPLGNVTWLGVRQWLHCIGQCFSAETGRRSCSNRTILLYNFRSQCFRCDTCIMTHFTAWWPEDTVKDKLAGHKSQLDTRVGRICEPAVQES